MTTFKYIIAQCGLSRQEAAEFLNVSHETINSWTSGRRQPPEGIFRELSRLYAKIRYIACGKAEKILDEDLAVIDPRFYMRWEIDNEYYTLPCEGCRKAAGALTMLYAISETHV